jgi:hypothetical protein
MSRTIFPMPLPSSMCLRADVVSSSGKVSLMTGRRPCSLRQQLGAGRGALRQPSFERPLTFPGGLTREKVFYADILI